RAEGQPYAVFRHPPEASLSERLSSSATVGELLGAGEKLAKGLLRAHEAAVIHGAIAPEALRVGEGAAVWGFGLFRPQRDSPYRAPEQREGDAVPSSDLYSLGCILYHALAGEAPNGEAPAPLRSLNGDVPEVVGRTIEKMIAADPRGRYSTTKAAYNSLLAARVMSRAVADHRLPPWVDATATPAGSEESAPAVVAAHAITIESVRPGAPPEAEATVMNEPRSSLLEADTVPAPEDFAEEAFRTIPDDAAPAEGSDEERGKNEVTPNDPATDLPLAGGEADTMVEASLTAEPPAPSDAPGADADTPRALGEEPSPETVATRRDTADLRNDVPSAEESAGLAAPTVPKEPPQDTVAASAPSVADTTATIVDDAESRPGEVAGPEPVSALHESSAVEAPISEGSVPTRVEPRSPPAPLPDSSRTSRPSRLGLVVALGVLVVLGGAAAVWVSAQGADDPLTEGPSPSTSEVEPDEIRESPSSAQEAVAEELVDEPPAPRRAEEATGGDEPEESGSGEPRDEIPTRELDSSGDESPEDTDSAAGEAVRVRMRGLLRGAVLKVDGVERTERIIELPVDGRRHTFEVTRDGYEPFVRHIAPTRDVVLQVTLLRPGENAP
ncbi:MAG: hypothetical protein AAGF12_39325, partial [Myxococcota bacterium]